MWPKPEDPHLQGARSEAGRSSLSTQGPKKKTCEESSSRTLRAGSPEHRVYTIQAAVNSQQRAPHHETVSNPAVGTTEQTSHMPMGMGVRKEFLAPLGTHQKKCGAQHLGPDTRGPSSLKGGGPSTIQLPPECPHRQGDVCQPGRIDLTAEGPHNESVSNPAVGTSE